MLVEIIFYFVLFITGVTTTISIYNMFTAPRLKIKKHNLEKTQLVSVLIPSRNEEKNIAECIDSVISQTYKNFELLILDDESTDTTATTISKKISSGHLSDRVKLISGKPLPHSWLGKNWACHQLSQEAKGDIFLFIDADVRLSEGVIESCLCLKEKYNMEMITSFPTQKIKSLGEWLIVPLMNFLLLTFLPLKKIYSSANKSFVAANGQFLFITNEVYTKIGGHKAFKEKVVEDMEIARGIKKSGLKLMTLLGDDYISCRMYEGFDKAFNGFSKNFFPGFNTSQLIFSLLLILIFFVYLLPFLLIFVNYNFFLIVLIILTGRLFISITSRQNFFINVILHPLQMIVMIAIGVNSVYRTKTKKLEWKGRSI